METRCFGGHAPAVTLHMVFHEVEHGVQALSQVIVGDWADMEEAARQAHRTARVLEALFHAPASHSKQVHDRAVYVAAVVQRCSACRTMIRDSPLLKAPTLGSSRRFHVTDTRTRSEQPYRQQRAYACAGRTFQWPAASRVAGCSLGRPANGGWSCDCRRTTVAVLKTLLSTWPGPSLRGSRIVWGSGCTRKSGDGAERRKACLPTPREIKPPEYDGAAVAMSYRRLGCSRRRASLWSPTKNHLDGLPGGLHREVRMFAIHSLSDVEYQAVNVRVVFTDLTS